MAATLGTGIDIGNGSENIFAAAGNCWQGGKIGTRRIGTALSLSITPYFGGGKPIVTFLFLAMREKQVGQGTWVHSNTCESNQFLKTNET